MPFLILLLLAFFAGTPPAAADDRLIEQGNLALDAGAFSEAISDFQQALGESPDDIKAHEGLAWAYYGSGDFAQAAKHADRRLALAPDDALWRRQWVLIVWEVPDRQQEVLATVRRWADEAPADHAAQRLLGRVLADAGDFDEGRRVLYALLSETPSDVEALITLASIERWDQRYEEARELLLRAATLKPGDELLQRDLKAMTLEARGHHIARLEPTLPVTLIVILASILFGQVVTRLTPGAHLAMFLGIGVLVAGALGWLYAFPLT